MQVRLPGEGDVGRDGGASGNLYVYVDVKEHAIFRREGSDLIYDLPINLAEATLGVEKEIPILDSAGKVETLKIPHGTQHGAEFRIRGKGVPYLHTTRRGDLRVLVDLQVPRSLNAEQRKLLEAFARSMDPNAGPDERSDSDPEEDPDKDKGLFDRIKGAFG